MNPCQITDKNITVIRLLTEDKYRIIRHLGMQVAFLALYISARLLFHLDEIEKYSGNLNFYHSLMPWVVFTGILYVNFYILMPLFFKGRYVRYFLLVLVINMAGLAIIHYIGDLIFEPYRINPTPKRLETLTELLAATIFTTPIVLATSMARLMQMWIKDRERINELNSLTVNMELDALKNQINPHFLFNMLNNVNVLVKTSPDKASSVILKLSEFLRYQLYENNAPTTSLMEECSFLSNFLNLEKVRRDNFSFTVTCQTPGSNAANILIPPNLFTTFVENAIKHSVDLSGNEAYVHILITAENNSLLFSCNNSVNPEDKYPETKNGGLGLTNVKRRLNLLYDDKYSLACQDNSTTYNVNLSIPYDLYYSR